MKRCPRCNASYADDFVFCPRDRVALVAVRERRPRRAIPWRAIPWRKAGAVLLGVGLLGIAGFSGWWWIGGRFPTPVHRALHEGRLVPPADNNAYELYRAMEASDPDLAQLEAIEQEALPRLDAFVEAALDTLYRMAKDPQGGWEPYQTAAEWALDIDPEDAGRHARAAFTRARVALEVGDPDAARRHYQQAAEAQTDWAMPVNGLGILHVRDGDLSDAIEDYQTATALDPEWPYPRLNLAGAWMEVGDLEEARRVADELAALQLPEGTTIDVEAVYAEIRKRGG